MIDSGDEPITFPDESGRIEALGWVIDISHDAGSGFQWYIVRPGDPSLPPMWGNGYATRQACDVVALAALSVVMQRMEDGT